MRGDASIKLVVILGLMVLLLLPLWLTEGQIEDRSRQQSSVVEDIAASAASAQTLVGPVVYVRYRELVESREKDEKTGQWRVTHNSFDRSVTLPPQRLDIDGDGRVETRHRGLYQARLYHYQLQTRVKVLIPPHLGVDAATVIADPQAFLVMGISDLRGIDNDPEWKAEGHAEHFVPGTFGVLPGPGIHMPLGKLDAVGGASFEVGLSFRITGTERLAVAPAGNATTMTLRSDWPHPSFQGSFLPISRTVGAKGFEAHWEVSHLARDFDRLLKHAPGSTDVGSSEPQTMDVQLIEPVNIYQQATRAVKYGLLFVALTFAAFFLGEILAGLAIHPVQYVLVGLALAIFFLLLIALSEHVPFLAAYLVSAAACVLLISLYVRAVLGSWQRSAGFATTLALLYTLLYLVIQSEDNALLMGALVLFLALGTVMLATRRVDWYALSTRTAKP